MRPLNRLVRDEGVQLNSFVDGNGSKKAHAFRLVSESSSD